MTTVITLPTGCGKTFAFLYHLSHMVARLEWRVLTVDLDPQAHLTTSFFGEAELERFWDADGPDTIATAVDPLMRGDGDVRVPTPQEVGDRLWVLPGDLALSRFEDRLSVAWPLSRQGDLDALRMVTAFHRIVQGCAARVGAHVVLMDVGPYLGAVSRSALLASDAFVVPLAADLLSLHRLRSLGPTLRAWRSDWERAVFANALPIPKGTMRPLGYVMLQHAVRVDRPIPLKAYDRIVVDEFHHSVLGEPEVTIDAQGDPYQLASLRNYRSLMPLAQDARKPMFDLKAADGALGSTGRLVQICYGEFQRLAVRLMDAAGIPSPSLV